MRTIYCILVCLGCYAGIVSAQPTFTISPNPAFGDPPFDPYSSLVYADIHNLAATLDTFVWVRTIIQIDSNCTTAVVDPFLSYPPNVSTRKFLLEPGASSMLNVYIFNNGSNDQPCCGIVHLQVTETTDPLNSITAVYLFGDCATGVAGPQLTDLAISPNPAEDAIRISNTGTAAAIRFYGIDGRYLKRLPISDDQVYSLAGLDAGTFIMVLEDRDGRYLRAVTAVKK